MVEATAGEQQVFNGTAPVPASATWDGKDKSGLKTAPDGLYTAVLTVEYAKGNVATAKSTPFRLAVTPPKVDLSSRRDSVLPGQRRGERRARRST